MSSADINILDINIKLMNTKHLPDEKKIKDVEKLKSHRKTNQLKCF